MKKTLYLVVILILIVSLGTVSFAAKTTVGSDIGDVYESNIKPVTSNSLFPYAINLKCGYIDKNGKEVIKLPSNIGMAYEFSEGLAVVYDKNTKLYGYIDKTGNYAIKPQFELATFFSEGLAAVKKNDKWSYIDYTGNYVIKDLSIVPQAPKLKGENPNIYFCGCFKDGYATIAVHTTYKHEDITLYDIFTYLIDKSGKMLMPEIEYKYIFDFSDGLAQIKVEKEGSSFYSDMADNCGFIDKSGKVVIEPNLIMAGDFSEGLASFRSADNGKYGFINTNGEVVIKPTFEAVSQFKDGLAQIRNEYDTCRGYINKKGEVVIEPTLDVWALPSEIDYIRGKMYQDKESLDFSEGLALFRSDDGKFGFINKKGQIVIQPKYIYASFLGFQNGLVIVGEDISTGNTFYIDKNGKFIHWHNK
ncbi:MAG: WG repeat-containing protein [Marinisporobacter sp.]|jgi:hypothetical protein|nr:WG repeat-containing protein [Marinisporobacter sp.]